jgi:uncharacterized protein
MLWKKSWQPEAVLMLAGGIVLSFFSGILVVEMLRRAGVAGFRTADDMGSVLLATLSLYGAVILLGIIFLKFHDVSWQDALGLRQPNWKRHLLLAAGMLVVVLPVMLVLKYISEIVLQKMGWTVNEQDAVTMFTDANSIWLRVYLGLYAVLLAPMAEEFVFRGLLFSAAKRAGWPKFAWLGVSFLFAVMHHNAPTFVPLFVFALALTWLYEKTQGLLAPMVAHSLFNSINLALLLLAGRTGQVHP